LPKKPRIYEVWILKRGRSSANKTKLTADRNNFPDSIVIDGKTYYWSGLHDRLEMVVYSEVDPKVHL